MAKCHFIILRKENRMKKTQKDFLLYGIAQNVTKKSYYETLLLLSLILIPTVFVGGISFVIILCCVSIYTMNLRNLYGKFDEQGIIQGYTIFLYYGLNALCMTIALLLAGVRIQFLLVPKEYKIAVSVGVVIGTVAILMLYVLLVNMMIKKGRYTNARTVTGGISFGAAGVFGMLVAKGATQSMNQQEVKQLLVGILFFLASISLIGVINLWKYYIIKNDEELMRELGETMETTGRRDYYNH